MSFRNIIAVLFAGLLLSSTSQAQEKNLTLGMLAMQQGNLLEAKQYIDQAAVHPETKNSAKMHNYRGQIYLSILRNPGDTTVYSPDVVAIAMESFYNSYKIAKAEENNRLVKEAREYLLSELTSTYYGYVIDQLYQNKLWDKTIAGTDLLLDVVKNIDKKKQLANLQVVDTGIYGYRIDAAYKSKKCDVVKDSYDSLVKMHFNETYHYLMMESCYTGVLNDTAKGLEVLEAAKLKFPNEKDFTDRELQLYMAMGKQNILLDKLNASLAKTPNDFAALWVRGGIYEGMLLEMEKKEDALSDSIDVYKERGRAAKTPALKSSYSKKQAEFQKTRDSLQKESGKYLDMAEQDYKAALNVAKNDTDRAAMNFNLASMTLHRTRPLVEKINSTNNEQNRKALETMLNEKYREVISYMLKVEKVNPNDAEALRILKQMYFSLGETAKYEEYDKKFKEANRQQK